MAQSFARCSTYQNTLFGGKNELAGSAPTKGNDTHIPTMPCIYIPVLVLAPNLAEKVFKYTNNNL